MSNPAQAGRPASASRTRLRRWGPLGLAGIGLVVAVIFLRRSLPDLHDIGRAVAAANGWWLVTAVLAQAVSIAMFAEQQRLLLRAFGGDMSRTRSVGLTLARTALSIALPGGAAVSSGYAIQEFRRGGVDVAAATAMTLLAGVQALAALVAIYLAWLGSAGVSAAHGSTYLRAAYVAVAVVILAIGAYLWRQIRPRTGPHPTGDSQRPTSGHRWRWVTVVTELATATARDAAELPMRVWALGTGYALANWVFDVLCLLVTARAFGLRVGLLGIVGAYLAVQLIRQIPLTPGGIGLVEASLLVALIAAGATNGTAAGVVLTYRLISCWAIAPIGLIASFALRAPVTRSNRAESGPTGRSQGNGLRR